MKKFLLVLMVVALASFLLTGCFGVPDGTEGEGEGEGEGEAEAIAVVVDGAVEVDGMTYVSGDTHDITVTFAAPAQNAYVWLTDCAGDYSKAGGSDTPIVLWPNADSTVWSGSANFACYPCDTGECVTYSDCCASYIIVESGECDLCETSFPIIVDCAAPEVDLNVRFVDCGDPCPTECEEIIAAVSMEFTSFMGAALCEDPNDCCGDDCSGIASWSVSVGDTLCAEPCDVVTGEVCPVEGVTDCCLFYATEVQGTICYAITFDIVDNVGNAIPTQTWSVCLDTDEVISFTAGTVVWDTDDLETEWMYVPITGFCVVVG